MKAESSVKWIDANYEHNGNNVIVFDIKIKWWLPSFWRMIRGEIKRSSIVAWPITAYLVLRTAIRESLRG